MGHSWSCRVHADCGCRREHCQCCPVYLSPTGHPEPPDGAGHESAALRVIRGLSALGSPGGNALRSPGPDDFLSVQWALAGAGDGGRHHPTGVESNLASDLNAVSVSGCFRNVERECSTSASSGKANHMSHDTLSEFVEATATRFGIPGVAAAVWEDSRETYACYGVTSVENPLPVDQDTLFLLGSITKSYTATALMHLVAEGRVDLESPVRRY